MDKKAFTLVELIVVITILAILGLISFISLQGFSIDARDAKRISDVRSLFDKIVIENTKGLDYSDIINPTGKTGTLLKINGETRPGEQNIENGVNFEMLRETAKNFSDPINGHPYPFAYAVGNAGEVGYNFVQLAYVEEKTGITKLIGSYYEMLPGDSPSLFKGCIGEGNENEIVKDGSCPIYDIGVIVYANCEINSNLEGYDVPATDHGQRTQELTKNIEGDNGTKIASFYCYNGEFKDKQERIECNPGRTGDTCNVVSTPTVSGGTEPVVYNGKYRSKPTETLVNTMNTEWDSQNGVSYTVCNYNSGNPRCTWSPSTSNGGCRGSRATTVTQSSSLGTTKYGTSITGVAIPFSSNTYQLNGSCGGINKYPAMKICQKMGAGWRLPTVFELGDICYDSNTNGSCATVRTKLSLESDRYWSSTENSTNNARTLGMGNSTADYYSKVSLLYVVCVHD